MNLLSPTVGKRMNRLKTSWQAALPIAAVLAANQLQAADVADAVMRGDTVALEKLFAAHADVNAPRPDGATALHWAVYRNDLDAARALVKAGAEVAAVNEAGVAPLLLATERGNPEMIALLLDAGTDVNQTTEFGWTALLTATQNRYYELGEFLLEHGADPNIATDTGVTPLMVASGIGWVEGVTYEWSPAQTLEVVKWLIDLGNDVNARDASEGRTALMGAAHKGRTDVIRAFVEHGADLAAHDVGSRDSIHNLGGVTWQAIDYADGLVRVGVQSAIPHPEAAALLREYMKKAGLKAPPEGRTLDSICVTPDLCR
jgi:ankyrin repeat protein